MVQKGKFSAGMPILESRLKSVDFPTAVMNRHDQSHQDGSVSSMHQTVGKPDDSNLQISLESTQWRLGLNHLLLGCHVSLADEMREQVGGDRSDPSASKAFKKHANTLQNVRIESNDFQRTCPDLESRCWDLNRPRPLCGVQLRLKTSLKHPEWPITRKLCCQRVSYLIQIRKHEMSTPPC